MASGPAMVTVKPGCGISAGAEAVALLGAADQGELLQADLQKLDVHPQKWHFVLFKIKERKQGISLSSSIGHLHGYGAYTLTLVP